MKTLGIGITLHGFSINYELAFCPFAWQWEQRLHKAADGRVARRWLAFGPFRVVYNDFAAMQLAQ